MKKQVRRSGFTLPEILVTVTVIAVLAAVVVPAVTQYVSKGDTPATESDLTQIRNAITAYSADTRAYPSTYYDLESQPSGLSTWKGPYTGATLVGGTAAGTFTSSGLNVKLGPAIKVDSIPGYVSTWVSFVSTAATCLDLYKLDKAIDGGAGDGSDAASAQLNGAVRWGTGTCDDNQTTTQSHVLTANGPPIALLLMAKGK